MIIPNAISPSHSLLVLPDETVIYLDTTGGTVVHFNPVSGEILSTSKVTDGFLRGVTIINDRTLVLGSNAELITFDLARKNVIQHIQLTKETNEFVYDLEVLPSHYSLPPVSFENHFLNISGYRNIEALIEERRLDDS